MRADARHREDGRARCQRAGQNELVGETGVDCGAAPVMLQQGLHRFLGDPFRRLAPPAEGKDSGPRAAVVFGQQEEPRALAGCAR